MATMIHEHCGLALKAKRRQVPPSWCIWAEPMESWRDPGRFSVKVLDAVSGYRVPGCCRQRAMANAIEIMIRHPPVFRAYLKHQPSRQLPPYQPPPQGNTPATEDIEDKDERWRKTCSCCRRESVLVHRDEEATCFACEKLCVGRLSWQVPWPCHVPRGIRNRRECNRPRGTAPLRRKAEHLDQRPVTDVFVPYPDLPPLRHRIHDAKRRAKRNGHVFAYWCASDNYGGGSRTIPGPMAIDGDYTGWNIGVAGCKRKRRRVAL